MSDDAIKIIVHDDLYPHDETYTLSPDLLYQHARGLIPKLLHLDGTDKTAMMMKVAIKGIFIAYGEKILEQIFKSKEHPKPHKGDDLVEWYIDLFAKIMILQSMKQEYTVEVNETSEIVGCVARPIPPITAPDNV
jgi:hypothetical protein